MVLEEGELAKVATNSLFFRSDWLNPFLFSLRRFGICVIHMTSEANGIEFGE